MGVMTRQRMQHLTVRRLIGKDMRDRNGEQVGTVDDLVLDIETGCARYAIVGMGGVLGVGEKSHVVPIQTLLINPNTGDLSLSTDKARLANSPTYDRNNPPDFADPGWQRSIHQYFGQQPPQGGGQEQQGAYAGRGGYAQQGGYGGRGGYEQQGGYGGRGEEGGMGQGGTYQPIGRRSS